MARINSNIPVVPAIYCYTTPSIPEHNGWCKIGYTEQNVDKRIKDQTYTADIQPKVEWRDNAVFADGSEFFTDKDFHAYLRLRGIEQKPNKEWFKISPSDARKYFYEFRDKPDLHILVQKYQLREEQEEAVSDTINYRSDNGGGEFLWNAKPRFGKTLSAYDFCRRIHAENVLIVTNRPAIGNSWYQDYERFLGRESGYFFVTQIKELSDKKTHPLAMPYSEYLSDKKSRAAKNSTDTVKMNLIDFVSLQDLKGSLHFGGYYNKLEEIKTINWDVLIIDEAHEGVDTYKTDTAFDHIKRKFTLHLSGTPFKAIKNDKFDSDAIYNWTYVAEQEAKEKWSGEGENPYYILPQLNMLTYRLSNIFGEGKPDLDNDDDDDIVSGGLNELFKATDKGFVHDTEVDIFLDALVNNDKFPFSSNESREELSHTFWLMFRVADAKAMAKKLREHPVFKDYEIVLAAGDGKIDDDDENEKSYTKVCNAIATHDRTITLSVGQLTTGVTIPEWSGVFILSEIKSPALYMQAAFRAQNPYLFPHKNKITGAIDGYRRKENSYVFDFNPSRSLEVVEQFANDLCSETSDGRGDLESRTKNIEKLLKYFPVIGEDEDGKMIPLDASKVLSIPRKMKAEEVVRRGFMSDMLFTITNVFRAPAEYFDIVREMPSVEKPDRGINTTSETADELNIDDKGDINIPEEDIKEKADELVPPVEKERIAEEIKEDIEEKIEDDSFGDNVEKDRQHLIDLFASKATSVLEVKDSTDGEPMGKSLQREVKRKIQEDATKTINKSHSNFLIKLREAEKEIRSSFDDCSSAEDKAAVDEMVAERQAEIKADFKKELERLSEEFTQKASEIVADVSETSKKIEERDTKLDEFKAHLKGFSRTIPSFLMAYGTDSTTLQNFDTVVPDSVFKEVTGISLDNFRKLRDGIKYVDEETGEEKFYQGMFEPTVFNDSVKMFLKRKKELSNYFDESQKEDIFDYIPPQKTNQIYTPKKVVKEMVDLLEQNNEGCFDDDKNTFIDLYMKSGLYIAEIVKRLYRSEKMKALYPDSHERLKHIFKKQVYGLAPTEIIYRIAVSFVLGFDESISIDEHNLRQLDALPYAQGTEKISLEEKLDELFGNNPKTTKE
ncbi:MAG: DEAD/DEAH box helicase family protein [Eubacterium sp.]|nr:DEAD/DEAH box helicase family protein [Eubacterium sp.]